MVRDSTPAFPSLLSLETINYCNAACIFCPLFAGNDRIDRKLRPASTMNMDLFKKIVLEVATWKVKPTILLNMDGEPLLDKQLPERLSILREIDLAEKAILQTNAEFLTSEASTTILKAGIPSIVIGFDGGSKAVYERHRVGCHYDVVFKNITTFVRLRRSLKGITSVGIKFVRTHVITSNLPKS